MYKLVASDVDGTLLGLDFTLHPDNKTTIANALQKGVSFCLCSGRSYKSLLSYHKELGLPADGYIIAFNGGVVYDVARGKVIFKELLGIDIGLRAIDIYHARQRSVEIFVYVDFERVLVEEHTHVSDAYAQISEILMEKSDDIAADVAGCANVIKIIFMGQNHVLQGFKVELVTALGDEADIAFSTEYLLEVGSKNCSKGNALAWLCSRLGVPVEQTITIGDNYNDISMVSRAGLGVAVANAVDDLKAIAGHVTKKTSAQGAVAEVLNKFVL